MPIELFANVATTTLTVAITDTASTTISVAASLPFPAATSTPPATQFRVKIDYEYMVVTNVSGLVWTVTRGVEGSLAATHTSGTAVTHVATAAALAGLSDGWKDQIVAPSANRPGISNVLDDEFNDGVLDPAWVRYDDIKAGASWREDGDSLSVLIRGSLGGGPNHVMAKSVGALTPPFEIITTTRYLTPYAYNYQMNGPIVFGPGVPGSVGWKYVWSRNYTNGGVATAALMSMNHGTSLTTEAGNYAPWGNMQWMAPVVHCRLTVLGGGWYENAVSIDGAHWLTIDIPWGPSIGPANVDITHIGLAVSNWTETTRTTQAGYDYFRVRALGPNLSVSPVGGGTVTASQSSNYNGSLLAGNALTADWGANCHLLGNADAIRFWRVDWSVAQAMSRIDVWGPGATDGYGEVRIDFSDGSSLANITLMHAGHQQIEFPRKTGITWFKISGIGAAAGNAGVNPGLKKVRVHDAT